MAGKEGTSLTGVDTNVLLRYILRDDPKQFVLASEAFARFTAQDPGFISLPVFCEFAWVLGRTYHWPRAEIAQVSELILNASSLEVQHARIINRALVHFRDSRADFADCCILALAEEAGCDRTLTFDLEASRLPGMHLLTLQQ